MNRMKSFRSWGHALLINYILEEIAAPQAASS